MVIVFATAYKTASYYFGLPIDFEDGACVNVCLDQDDEKTTRINRQRLLLSYGRKGEIL